MDAEEVKSCAALVEETSNADELIGRLLNEASRDPTKIFCHISGCSAQSGVHCNCTYAKMNFNEISELDAAAQSGVEGLATTPTIQFKLSQRENRVLSNISSFFGIVTAPRAGAQPFPKPISALRMMTNVEAGRSFWGPNGIITKSLASFRAAIEELRALVARQAVAILRLLNHLANPGGGAAPAAIAAGSATAPAALARPAPPAAAEPQPSLEMLEIATLAPALAPPPAPARPPPPPDAAAEPAPPARADPDGGGGLTVDQLVPLLCKALKLSKPRSKQPTISGGLHRSTVYRRRQNCGPMTDIWMENCGLATNESDPARIVAAVAPERRRMRSRAVAVNADGPPPPGCSRGAPQQPGRRRRRAAAADGPQPRSPRPTQTPGRGATQAAGPPLQ
jgi:hypothetical protein